MWSAGAACHFSRTQAPPPSPWVTSLRHCFNTIHKRKRKKALEFCVCLLLQKSLLQCKVAKYSLAAVLVEYSPFWNHALHFSVGLETFFCPFVLTKKKKRKEVRGILVQHHLSHPAHVTLRRERKAVAKRGSGRWFSGGGWNERQSSTWKNVILLGGLTGTQS